MRYNELFHRLRYQDMEWKVAFVMNNIVNCVTHAMPLPSSNYAIFDKVDTPKVDIPNSHMNQEFVVGYAGSRRPTNK